MTEKFCTKCGEIKPLTEFNVRRASIDGLQPLCVKCEKKRQSDYYQRNKDAIKAKVREYAKVNAEDVSIRRHNYYLKNKESETEYNKRYAEDNREKFRAYNKSYRNRHIERLRSKARLVQRHRMIDPQNRISNAMSCGIRRTIKNKDSNRWESLVKYSAEDLLNHLESLFSPGMTFENHGRGGWHIDHIKPIVSFSFSSSNDKEFHECWALGNLQPLWEFDNLSKGAKWSQA